MGHKCIYWWNDPPITGKNILWYFVILQCLFIYNVNDFHVGNILILLPIKLIAFTICSAYHIYYFLYNICIFCVYVCLRQRRRENAVVVAIWSLMWQKQTKHGYSFFQWALCKIIFACSSSKIYYALHWSKYKSHFRKIQWFTQVICKNNSTIKYSIF